MANHVKVAGATTRTRDRGTRVHDDDVKPTVIGDAPTIEAGGKTYVIVAGDIAVVSYADLPTHAQS